MSAFARSPADNPAFSPTFSAAGFAAPSPAQLPEDTLALVRGNVRDMLLSSPAFRALPAEKQREVAHNTVKVARFIADAGGETAGVPMTAVITNPAARPLAAPARPFAPPPMPGQPSGGQTGFDPASKGFDPSATSQLAGQAEALVDAIDFPGFCADLIKGVFTAIVKTSIQQMEAYATMVANVAKSVDQYMQDNVSNEQAMDQLVNGHPELFEADFTGDQGAVKQRDDANSDQMGGFLQSLGLPFDLDTSDPEVVKNDVVPAQRMTMAMDRQKLLATMVLMGINRIVVTDGRIQASVVFDMSAKDIQQRNYERATSFSQNYMQKYKKKKQNGWWIFSNESESDESLLKVRSSVDTSQSDQSESQIQLKTKLTGNVDLRFKSDYFPLEKMLDMLGTNQAVITQVAQQATPQQAMQVQPIAPPPAPALPPPPAFAGGAAPVGPAPVGTPGGGSAGGTVGGTASPAPGVGGR